MIHDPGWPLQAWVLARLGTELLDVKYFLQIIFTWDRCVKDTINCLQILMKMIQFKSRTTDWCALAAPHNTVVSSWNYLISHWLAILSSALYFYCVSLSKGLVPFTQLVKVRKVTWFWHFQASDFHETFTRSSLALNMSRKLLSDP